METNDNAHDVTIDRTVYQTIYAVKDGANGYISDRICVRLCLCPHC